MFLLYFDPIDPWWDLMKMKGLHVRISPTMLEEKKSVADILSVTRTMSRV